MNTEFEPQENIIVTISCSYTNSEIPIRILDKQSEGSEYKNNILLIVWIFFTFRSMIYISYRGCMSLYVSIICKI